jgi:ABC-type amino acid transport substrate-binding protein
VVGTSGDSPPYAFRRDESLAGLEIDLATELGKSLDRPVRFVDLPWDELFDALADRRVDVVMDGVTVTAEREVRFAFSQPYLRSTIAALVRREDRARFKDRDAVCKSPMDVGVVTRTTGEKYVRERCPAMIPRVYQTAPDAVLELRQRRVDAVVHDGPVLLWLLSEQGAELEIVPTRIADERLAWMLRPEDTELRDAANAALARMRTDGTLARILQRWVPQHERLQAD